MSVEPKSERDLLAEVERLLARYRGRPFPVWLEATFERETGARYAQLLSEDLRRTAIYYNLMLAGDFLLAPDSVLPAAALHFLLVTPVMLLVATLCRRGMSPLARDLAAAAVPLLICCQILFIFSISQAPTASHYLFFVSLNVATVNSAMRLRRRAAAWATYASFALLPTVLAITHKMTLQVEAMHFISLVNCGLVTLRGMGDREREFRRGWLARLRDSLRIALTDAEAQHDPLTGVANRRGLELAVRAAWSAGRRDDLVAVVLFDVDKFKAFNDLYGHPAGDACLKAIARAARTRLDSSQGLIARYGGEEFLVLLIGAAAAEADRIAEELRQAVLALEIPHAGGAERGVVSASFGVARGYIGDTGFDALTSKADAALYAAKSAGRNRVTRAAA